MALTNLSVVKEAAAMIWRNTGPGHDIAIAYVVPESSKAGRVVDASLLRTLLMDKVAPRY